MKRLVMALAALVLCGATDDERIVRIDVSGPQGQRPIAKSPADIVVRVRDPATGFGLSGAMPALWLVPEDGDTSPKRCERLVNRLAGAATLPPDSLDLNGFDLVQATADGNLALVDPVLNLASANIRAIAPMGGVPVAWAIDASGHVLAVAAKGSSQLRLIDARTLKTLEIVEVGSPVSSLGNFGGKWWVGDKDGRLLIFPDSGTLKPHSLGRGKVAVHPTGSGMVALARSGGGAFFDAAGSARTFELGHGVEASTFVPLADSLFALTDDGTALAIVAADASEVRAAIALEVPMSLISADPAGRWLALVARDGRSVAIVDVAARRTRWTLTVDDVVIAADFSDNFLYLMHRSRGGASRVVFDPTGGPPAVVAIAAGSDQERPQEAGALPLMARIPGAGMLVASRRDRKAYMISDDNAQAAMSSMPLRAGEPVGVLLRPRGLVADPERGTYRANAVFERGGRYTAVVRTAQPELAHCATVTVAAAPGETVAMAHAASALPDRQLVVPPSIAPGPVALGFSVTGKPKARLTGVALVGNGWQRFPSEISSMASGYTVAVDVAAGRDFTLFVEIRDGDASRILTAPIRVTRR